MLGTPLDRAVVVGHLVKTSATHEVLFERIPMIGCVKSSWLLLFVPILVVAAFCCAATKPMSPCALSLQILCVASLWRDAAVTF